MRLFGLSPIWEVRVVNKSIKKDLPGTRLWHGSSYRKARAAYLKNKPKVLADHMIKLQAVSVVAMHWKMSRETAQVEANIEASQRLDNIAKMSETDVATALETKKPSWPEPPITAAEYAIEESNARQSEYMAKHQDEPNAYNGSDPDDHTCNYSGPMTMGEDGAYHPTCSICDTAQ